MVSAFCNAKWCIVLHEFKKGWGAVFNVSEDVGYKQRLKTVS